MTRMMKVTVFFDDIGVLVPCCGQDLPVSGLLELAVARYKKAIGKPSEYLVVVHHLKSSSGAILDLDDRVFDVIDDREHVFASYEEEGEGVVRLSRGDGTSASSIGTTSPDITKQLMHLMNDSRMLRQASEPALARDPANSINNNDSFDENFSQDDTILSIKKFESVPRRKYGSIENPHKTLTSLPPLGFARNLSTRKSVFRGSKNQELDDRHLRTGDEVSTRTDPVGSSNFADPNEPHNDKCQSKWKLVELANDGESLGIHVVPDYDPFGKSSGLLVHSVDALGRIARDGRIREMDKIAEINGKCLSGVDFALAQNILKEALNSDKLILRIVPYNVPVYYANKTENSPSTKHRSIPVTSTPAKDSEQNTPLKSRFPRPSFGKAGVSLPSGPFSTPAPRPTSSQPFKTQRNVPSTCSKINQSQQQRQEASQEARSMASTDLCSTPMTRTPAKNDTTPKRVGFLRTAKTMNIQLSKGCYGLGFSITTRDVPIGRNCPIYIKHILPQGAAIADGRLQPGDKLLGVNGMDVSKKGHDEVVAYLRSIKLGGMVELLIERTSDENRSTVDGQRITYEDRSVEYLIISLEGDIGIGMSVRGKTKQEENGTSSDLGLFVKTIHPDGAAARDGRLKVDDRIVEANGESLAGLSNSEAREVLKDAMQLDGPSSQTISFVIERFKDLNTALTCSVYSNQERTPRFNQISKEKPCPIEGIAKEGVCSSRPPSAKRKYSSVKEHRHETSDGKKEDNEEKEDLDLTMVSSNLSPIHPDSAPMFSRTAPGRQSMSEKRKNQFDQRTGLHNQIRPVRPNAQEHNDTQITLKRALSAESLVSQNNTTIVKTPQVNTRTCGLMKEALKKYTSVENVTAEVKTCTGFGREKVQGVKSKSKDSSDSSEQGKKKFRNIFKGLNIFKSKQKKESKTVEKNCQPSSHKMIDNLLSEKMRSNLHPCNRNKFDRPLSSCLEQELWNERPESYDRYRHYNQQSSIRSAFLPMPANTPLYTSKACYCDSYTCQPPGQSYQHRYYAPDYSHCRTSSRSYFLDPFHGFMPHERYPYYPQDVVDYRPLYSQEPPRKVRHPPDMYYDEDFDDDLNNTISTIHQF